VFFMPSHPEPYWVLDFKSRSVRRMTQPPQRRAGIVHIREAILADAMQKQVVAFIHISMRVRIDLAAGGVSTDFLFWGLLSLQELGYFPLHKVLTRRAARVLWRRRLEVWGVVRSLLSFKSLDQKVMGNLMRRRRGVAS